MRRKGKMMMEILLILLMVCGLFTACGGKEEKAEEKTPEETADVSIGEADGGAEEAEIYTLYDTEKQYSVSIKGLEGYEFQSYSDEYGLTFEQAGENGGSTQMVVQLSAQTADEVGTVLAQEVEYLLSANADGTPVLEAVQSQEVDGCLLQYFHYAYTSGGVEVDGYRIFTGLPGGGTLTCMAEKLGDGSWEIESLLKEIPAMMQE